MFWAFTRTVSSLVLNRVFGPSGRRRLRFLGSRPVSSACCRQPWTFPTPVRHTADDWSPAGRTEDRLKNSVPKILDPPGRVREDFVHQEDELFMLVDGKIELEMQGRKMRPAVGEEVLIQGGTRHSLRNVGDSIARFLYAFRRN